MMEVHPVRRRRGGFSLIELLVVMGVILLLITLAVVGYNVIEKNVANRGTQQTLQNLRAMLSELDAQAGSTALPTITDGDVAGGTGVALTQINSQAAAPPLQLMIGDVNAGTDPADANGRYGKVIRQTQVAMGALMRVPKNKAAVGQLPPKQILRAADGSTMVGTVVENINGVNATVNTGPVLLDGWGNPIIYVPPGGIVVNVVTSSTTTGGIQQVTIKSPDNRAFFASAGQDGNFGAVTPAPTQAPAFGDDNLYSFQN